MSSEELRILTLYDRPDDFPDKYVVREWFIRQGSAHPVPGEIVFVSDCTPEDLEDLKEKISALGLIFIPRNASDLPSIIGTFV